MKYLDSLKQWPMKRLDFIIGLRSVDGDMPYKELDALYSYIFSCVEVLAITLKILGFLFCRYPSPSVTAYFLALILGLDEEGVYLHLSEPILLFISLLHTTLMDWRSDRRMLLYKIPLSTNYDLENSIVMKRHSTRI
jgi:hypothetical protein